MHRDNFTFYEKGAAEKTVESQKKLFKLYTSILSRATFVLWLHTKESCVILQKFVINLAAESVTLSNVQWLENSDYRTENYKEKLFVA
jgi:hypothetical protein